MDDPVASVRRALERNRYMVLGTTEPDGTARLSPVFFTHTDARTFYWVSSPDAQHSRNLTARPKVSLVIFDGDKPPVEDKDAVYISATAEQVPDEELEATCPTAFTDSERRGARAFTPHELTGDADLRLYRATAQTHEIHLRGKDPANKKNVDTRLRVDLP
ncbi:pyridoxamine 5'-phosphate oxidase family protein [Kribbella sp. HUAS MG21]|uniref:Pyridoxamine 5'-phosphate oxidase family protein n=1 Tax=Kribbella sp. HUAS MG21 TaxID=3160966 RepID=A0AAU7T5Q5_9ACTN